MLARADLHPYWEHHYFFSKPPLVLWLAALGLFLASPAGERCVVGPLLPVRVHSLVTALR